MNATLILSLNTIYQIHHSNITVRINNVFQEFEEWLKMSDVSSRTVELLRENGVLNLQDLELLTMEDIKQFGLLVGEKNRLKTAIKKLHQ